MAAVTLAVAGWGAMALPATAAPKGLGDPAGNNGSVKVTSHGEDDGIPQNTPQVACDFDIEWYGFDMGAHIRSEVEFTMSGPNVADLTLSGPAQVEVGEDPAGGGNDFDGEGLYHLSSAGSLDPVHMKITVHTPGSQGADTKHKVVWVQPCEEPPPPPVNF